MHAKLILLLLVAVVTVSTGSSQRALGETNEPPAVLPPPGSGVPGLLPVDSDPLPTIDTAEEVAPALIVEPPPPPQVFAWYQPGYWFGPDPWDIGFELGLNGNAGINEAFSLRAGTHVKRETEFWKLDASLFHNKNTANSVETQNNAQLDVRIDRLLGDSPWSIFVLNQDLYDEFQAFDLRVALNSGVAYQFIDTETLKLLERFGLGSSREFGELDDSWAFEALFGLEYEQQLSAAQRLSAKVDYFPEWEDYGLYRVVTDVGWEIDLDRPKNVSLKLSVIDRYDSTPGGVDPNEVNYAVLMIWGL